MKNHDPLEKRTLKAACLLELWGFEVSVQLTDDVTGAKKPFFRTNPYINDYVQHSFLLDVIEMSCYKLPFYTFFIEESKNDGHFMPTFKYHLIKTSFVD